MSEGNKLTVTDKNRVLINGNEVTRVLGINLDMKGGELTEVTIRFLAKHVECNYEAFTGKSR